MKVVLAFAAALALSVTAASAQTPQTPQSTPTVNGSTSPQSSPPAQSPGSLGTLPAQNTQPAADRTASTRPAKDRSGKHSKDMQKPRKQKKTSSSSTM